MTDLIAGAQGLLEVAQSALNLTNGLQKLAGGTKLEPKLVELHGVVLSTQAAAVAALREQLSLENEKQRLENKLAALERWEEEAARYEITSPEAGVVVYKLKTEQSPSHYLCPNCFHQRRKSFIQRTAELLWAESRQLKLHVHVCPACQANYNFDAAPKRESRPTSAAKGDYF